MNKEQVRQKILDVGIIPVVRASSGQQAIQAAEAVCAGGIPIDELTMTVPGAVEVISQLVKTLGKEVLIGAGTVLDVQSAQRCLDVGAQFLVSPGFDLATVQLAKSANTDDGWRPYTNRSHRGLESGQRLREDISMRDGWRREVHQGAEGTPTTNSHGSDRRRELGNCCRLHSCGGRCTGYRWRPGVVSNSEVRGTGQDY